MILYSIASGSSGNSIFVGEKEGGILVDVGISMKRVAEGLSAEGMDFSKIHGIFITHEHSDHVKGLGPILRKYKVPVFGMEKTIQHILNSDWIGKVDSNLLVPIKKDQDFSIEGMTVRPFATSHDAVDPVCYSVEKEKKKIVVATDMGTFSDYTVSHIKDANAVLLEANHDVNMLQVGSYPYSLKRRILSDKGHLSNDTSSRLLERVLSNKLEHVMLGHLSQENNIPELAYQTVKYELEKIPEWNEFGIHLDVAKRTEPSELITI